MTEMATGTVEWFNKQKASVLARHKVGRKDVFIHISAVDRAGLTSLRYEQKVTFDLESDRDGRQSAKNIALT